MNKHLRAMVTPWESIAEQMLAAVAIKIELPPSKYALLAERKAVVERYLERDGSPLKDRVRLFYQQGSVAIGATIQAKSRSEGFDIDIIAELAIRGLSPAQALDLLYEAVRGDPRSRYHNMAKRQTRCVTIHYSDGMHLDLSPSELIDGRDPRRSHIFHSKPEDPRDLDRRVLTNSFGFVDEYRSRCPEDLSFQKEYARRAIKADKYFITRHLDADSQPVPEHSSIVGGKSAVTVALQLLKRYRNIRWAGRGGRMPASVMFSALALEVAAPDRTIGQNLQIIAQHILRRLLQAQKTGRLIRVENPRCSGDIFTDRWPENQLAQELLIEDMQRFLRQLDAILDDSRSLKDHCKTLKAMFGEDVGQAVVDDLAQETGRAIRSGKHGFGVLGGVVIPSSVTDAKPVVMPSTFYGSKWPSR